MTHLSLHSVFVLLSISYLLLIITISSANDENLNNNQKYVDRVVAHLNSIPSRIYNYNSANILDAQNQNDKINFNLRINVECRDSYKNECGSITSLNCQVLFSPNHDDDNLIQYESDCSPEQESPVQSESDATTSSPRRPYCPGCPTDLNISHPGVIEFTSAAINHINVDTKSSYVLNKVLRLQRQVLETVRSGVKYILLIEINESSCTEAPSTTCPLSICEVSFLEKPILESTKHITSNNCTVGQEFIVEIAPANENRKPHNNENNEINLNAISEHNQDHFIEQKNVPNYEAIAQTGISDDILKIAEPNYKPTLVASHIHGIESQVIASNREPTHSQMTEPSELSDHKKVAIDGLLDVFGFDAEPKITKSQNQNVQQERVPVVEPLIVPIKAVVKFQKPLHRGSNDEVSNISTEESLQQKPTSDEENIKGTNREKRDLNINRSKLESTTDDEIILINNLAEVAVKTLDNIDTDEHMRVVLKILNSKKLYFDGVIYHLTLKVGVSECMEDAELFKSLATINLKESTDFKQPMYQKCKKNIFPDLTMICNVQVHVTDEKTNPKVVKSQCQNYKKNGERSNRTGGRQKREFLVGGKTPMDTNDPRVHTFVQEALQKLDESSTEPQRLKATQIISATSQVVAGAAYDIELEIGFTDIKKSENISYDELKTANLRAEPQLKQCKIHIWDRPWLKEGRETSVSCSENEINFKYRSKRGIPGGVSPLETTDPRIEKYLEGAFTQLDASSNEPHYLKPIEVINATTQVVAGSLDTITIRIGYTDIEKSKPVTYAERKTANLRSDPQTTICVVKIWDRPWLPNGRETKINCENSNTTLLSRSKRQVTLDKSVELFENFIKKHNKVYESKNEYKKRYMIFKGNLKKINLLNQYEQGTAKYGVNFFADLSKKEFKQYLGLRPELRNENELSMPMAKIPNDSNLPKEFDWRDKGVVTEVKNQGQCGSCWAFSVTGNIEGQYAIKTGKLLEFSEQELVDCDKLDDGCNGGLPDNAYRAIEKMGGLETEKDYPYDAEDEECHFDKSKSRVQVTGAVNITSNETAMAQWLYANGPISIGINANAMQFYMGGVSHPWKFLCNPKDLDHGVLIVGYGVHSYKLFNKTLPFWTIKNSWGPTWGEHGYYRVYRGSGTCGVNQMASSAIVDA